MREFTGERLNLDDEAGGKSGLYARPEAELPPGPRAEVGEDERSVIGHGVAVVLRGQVVHDPVGGDDAPAVRQDAEGRHQAIVGHCVKRARDLGFQSVGNREHVLKQIAANEIEKGRSDEAEAKIER